MEHALDFLMRDNKHRLLFRWDQAHCTEMGLPWEVGEYDESNTLLVENHPHLVLDDLFSHLKPHSTIFPYTYLHNNTEDNSLGPEGDLRIYLERLAASDNVQKFVSENSFDQQLVHVGEDYPWIFPEDYAECKNTSELKANSSTPLAAKTSLEPGSSTTTALVDLSAQTSTEPQTTAVTITDYQQDWPFIKQSPIWANIDSLVSCLTTPQKPHFFPLKKTKELHREGSAIAHMMTCYNLVRSLPNIKLNDPVDIINDNLEVLVDLEAHGFDVDLIRCRLNELLSMKSKAGQHEDTLKELEKRSYEKLVIEKEMDQLKVEMEKLQEKMMHAKTMRKAKEEELVRLQSNLHPDFTQINDWEVAFGKLAATPL
ncbi:putative HAD superfamily protein [Helianthus debilis subsp. tardiflorus]